MFKKIIALVLVIATVLAFAAIASAETVKLAYESGSLRLRKGPGTEYETVAYLKNGDKISVLEKGSVWSKIETFGGKKGYIKNLYISGNGSEYADGTDYFDSPVSGKVKTKYAESKVYLRSGANSKAKAIDRIKNGTKLTVLGKNGSWYLVKTADGTQGFMSATYVSTSGGSTQTTATVIGNRVFIRAGAGTEYITLDKLNKGTKVTVLSTSNSKWWKIRYKNTEGYMYSKYLSKK